MFRLMQRHSTRVLTNKQDENHDIWMSLVRIDRITWSSSGGSDVSDSKRGKKGQI